MWAEFNRTASIGAGQGCGSRERRTAHGVGLGSKLGLGYGLGFGPDAWLVPARRAAAVLVAALTVILTGALGASGQAAAQWIEVGDRSFALSSPTVSIPVTKDAALKGLRLVSRGASVTITNIRVIYRDGSTATEQRRFSLARGERTRVLAQRATGKPVRAVVLTIEPAAVLSQPARIVVLGLAEPVSATPPPSATAPPMPEPRPRPKMKAAKPDTEQRAADTRQQDEAQARAEAEQRRMAEARAGEEARRAADARRRAEAEQAQRAAQERARVEAETRARQMAEARQRQEAERRYRERAAPPTASRPAIAPSSPPSQPHDSFFGRGGGSSSGGSGSGGTSRSVSRPPVAPATPPPAMEGLGRSGTGDGRGGSEPGRIGDATPAPTSPPASVNGGSAPLAESTIPPVAAAGPAPEPVIAPEADWDVVPVFYGTDRATMSDPKRIQYGSTRGKQLLLGRALVTVPKAHQVPNVERPWALTIPYLNITLYQEKEDPKKHFTMKEIRELSREELLALVRERLGKSVDYKDHALVFVHGFNNTFDAAVFRTAQIAYDLKFDGAPFHYSWPSKGELGATDYSYDRESAGQSEPYFRAFMEMVVKETGAKHISVVAHSMGNQLLLATLRSLKPSMPEGVTLNQIILAAPDVDRDAFEFLAKEVMGISRGITLLAAGNDRALEISRRFWGGVPRAGDVPEAGPVIVQGVDTIDITAMSTAMFALNHSGFAEKTALLEDIQHLIQTGQRPPDLRVPTLESIATPKGPYWRWPIQ